MSALTISEARASLPALVTRAAEGEQITITRHGKPVARLIGLDPVRSSRMRDIESRVAAIDALFDAARERPLRGTTTTKRAEELVAAIRADRDSR